MESNQPKGFFVTFATTTPESEEFGDIERSGWWMPGEGLIEGIMNKPKELPFAFDQDADSDADEHQTLTDAIVAWATGVLCWEGAMHPNATHHPATWSTEAETLSFERGETMIKTFHFEGFSPEEIEAINLKMLG